MTPDDGGTPPADTAYATAGNTELIVGASITVPTTPHAREMTSPLASSGATVSAPGAMTSTKGGSATVESDGDFSYMPPSGFTGTDSLVIGTSAGNAIVEIDVMQVVRYVDNSAAGPGTGRSNDPFPTIAAALSGLPSGGTVFVGAGSGPYAEGVRLGAGHALQGPTTGGFSVGSVDVVGTTGTHVELAVASTDTALVLAQDNAVAGIDVTGGEIGVYATGAMGTSTVDGMTVSDPMYGVWLEDASGSATFTDYRSSGTTEEGFSVTGGDPVVDVEVAPAGITSRDGWSVAYVWETTGGSVTFHGGPVQSIGGGEVYVGRNAGPITFDSFVRVDSLDIEAILASPGTAPITFDSISIDAADGGWGLLFTTIEATPAPLVVRSGSIKTVNGAAIEGYDAEIDVTLSSVTTTGGPQGIYMVDAYGSLSLGTVDITGDGTLGLGAFDWMGPQPLQVTIGGGTIDVQNELGVYFQGCELDVVLDYVGNTGDLGMAFDASSGSVSIPDGSVATFEAYDNTSGLTVTYGGDIVATSSSDESVYFGQTAGTFTINGSVTDTIKGIYLKDSPDASLTISGTVDVDTPGQAFYASNGGTVALTGTGNLLEGDASTVLTLLDTNIGPAGFTVEAINGAAPFPIRLERTGDGPFSLTGTGSAGSAGTLAPTTSQAVLLVDTGPVSLSHLVIDHPNGYAIRADSVDALTLTDVDIVNPADQTQLASIYGSSWGPITFDDVTVDGGGIRWGALDMDLIPGGTGSVAITGGTFTGFVGPAIVVSARDGATGRVAVDGATITSTDLGIDLESGVGAAASAGGLDVTLLNNSISSTSDAVQVTASHASSVCLNAQSNAAVSSGATGISVVRNGTASDTPTFNIERLNGGTGTVTSAATVESHLLSENGSASSASASAVTVPIAFEGVAASTCQSP